MSIYAGSRSFSFTGRSVRDSFPQSGSGMYIKESIVLIAEQWADGDTNSSDLVFTGFIEADDRNVEQAGRLTGYRGWLNMVIYVMVGETEYIVDTFDAFRGNAGFQTIQEAGTLYPIGNGGTDAQPQWIPWTSTINVPHNADGTLTIRVGIRPLDGATYLGNTLQWGSEEFGYYEHGTGSSFSWALAPIVKGLVRVYNNSTYTFRKYKPYVYTNGQWKPASGYVRTGNSWKPGL